MKRICFWLVFQLIILGSYAQNNKIRPNKVIPNNVYFKSVFSKTPSGNFQATANGILILKNAQNKEVILDFQGSKANLLIEEDTDTIYDVSWKRYQATTTSGKTKICYSTYAMANGLEITYGNQIFNASGLDGAHDNVIEGLSYFYISEKETEYLIITVQKEIILVNKSRESHITLQPHSVLVYAVKRV